MNDTILIVLPLVATLAWCCLCIGCIACVRDAGRTLTIEIHNPVITVHSAPDAEPEDPVDFSSNPKSSSISVGS